MELCWASFGHVVVLEVGKLVFLREMSAHVVLCSRVSLWGCWLVLGGDVWRVCARSFPEVRGWEGLSRCGGLAEFWLGRSYTNRVSGVIATYVNYSY